MKIKDFLLEELQREVKRSRAALEQVPSGKYDWKPHEKSMTFGYLANLVATIPTWIAMQINQAQLDVAPATGGTMEQKRLDESEKLLQTLEKASAEARTAFENTSDEHLKTNWRLLAGGQVVLEAPRYEMIPGHVQSLGSPSWSDDCLFAVNGRQGSFDLRPVRRR